MPQRFVFGLMQGLAISAVMVATSRDVLRGMHQPPPTAEQLRHIEQMVEASRRRQLEMRRLA